MYLCPSVMRPASMRMRIGGHPGMPWDPPTEVSIEQRPSGRLLLPSDFHHLSGRVSRPRQSGSHRKSRHEPHGHSGSEFKDGGHPRAWWTFQRGRDLEPKNDER